MTGAFNAGAGDRVTAVSVPVALATLAVREVPVSWLTLVTLTAVRVGPTFAFTCNSKTTILQLAFALVACKSLMGYR